MQRLLSQLSKITKICSIICGVLLILHSTQMLYFLSSVEAKHVILAFNYILLAVLLILSEFHLNFIVKYFKLLDRIVGRGIYTFLVGTLLISNPSDTVSFLLSILFMIIGASYIILGILNEKENPNNQKLVEYVQKDDNDNIGEVNSVPVPAIKI